MGKAGVNLDLKSQNDLAFLALSHALAGNEGRADHIRAIARARYDEATRRLAEKEVAIA